jgi:hypothetical protein
MNRLKQRHAVHPRHLHIGQHRLRARHRNPGQGVVGAVHGLDREAVGFEPDRDQLE